MYKKFLVSRNVVIVLEINEQTQDRSILILYNMNYITTPKCIHPKEFKHLQLNASINTFCYVFKILCFC